MRAAAVHVWTRGHGGGAPGCRGTAGNAVAGSSSECALCACVAGCTAAAAPARAGGRWRSIPVFLGSTVSSSGGSSSMAAADGCRSCCRQQLPWRWRPWHWPTYAQLATFPGGGLAAGAALARAFAHAAPAAGAAGGGAAALATASSAAAALMHAPSCHCSTPLLLLQASSPWGSGHQFECSANAAPVLAHWPHTPRLALSSCC